MYSIDGFDDTPHYGQNSDPNRGYPTRTAYDLARAQAGRPTIRGGQAVVRAGKTMQERLDGALDPVSSMFSYTIDR